jgi:cold-inducible RNA-binding protein
MNIYVSNISYTATDEALQAAFAAYGEVTSARIIKDRLTSRSRGFGFVEMANDEEGKKALEALAGADLMGRAISVREARPREEGEKKQGAQAGGSGEGGATATRTGDHPAGDVLANSVQLTADSRILTGSEP